MNNQDPHRYDDMLDLPHHVSKTHPQMPLAARAAQFSPFAALVGYEEQIEEAARWTDAQRALSEQAQAALDLRLQWVQEHLAEQPALAITYFVPDARKAGGRYERITGRARRVDLCARQLLLAGGRRIPLDAIAEIEREEPAP